MDDLIKSLEKKNLVLDKESIKRQLTKKEKKVKENLKYEIYWAKFKKFKADFNRLIFTDVKELANSLKTPFLQKNIVLITETDIKKSRRFFNTNLPIYMILSITEKSFSLVSRWERSPFFLIIGNQENDTIEVYDCNQDLKDVSSVIQKKAWGSPIVQFKIDEYKFDLLTPHIEKWIDRNLDIIVNSKFYKKKNKII